MGINIPVAATTSILSSKALGKIISEQYGFNGSTLCEFYLYGVSDTYRVRNENNTYFLRVYNRKRNIDYISSELDFLKYLFKAGFDVAVPIDTKRHKAYIEIIAPEGKRVMVLFSEAKGNPINLTSSSEYEKLGMLIGRFHNISDKYSGRFIRPKMNIEKLLYDPLRKIKPFLKDRPEVYRFFSETAKKVEKRLKKYPLEKPSYGICHGDLQAKNIHINNNGKITFFDFDLCGYNWRAFDIAGLTFNNIKFKSSLVKGYRSIREFNRRELLSIKYFEIALVFWAMGFHIKISPEHGIYHINSEYFDYWLDRLKMYK